MIDLDKAIANVVKTGKVVLGADEAAKSARSGKAQVIIVASSSRARTYEDLQYYGHLSGIPIVLYKGSSVDLGMTCGKRFAVSALTVKEPGDSSILDIAQEFKKEQETTEDAEVP